MTRLLALCLIFFATSSICSPPAISKQFVPLELLLAMDVSDSVDENEFALQQLGLATAFLDPQVTQAIEAMGGIAVSVMQWAGEGAVATSIDWTEVNNAVDAARLAARIAETTRQAQGFTAIGSAIRASIASIEDNAFNGARLVIDVSGDGTATQENPSIARDQANALGITVNGLVILVGDMDLGILADEDTTAHYRDFVVGGPGAFLIIADGFEDFARAMQEKLLREISGPMMSSLDQEVDAISRARK